jgi:hypothetical protein
MQRRNSGTEPVDRSLLPGLSLRRAIAAISTTIERGPLHYESRGNRGLDGAGHVSPCSRWAGEGTVGQEILSTILSAPGATSGSEGPPIERVLTTDFGVVGSLSAGLAGESASGQARRLPDL